MLCVQVSEGLRLLRQVLPRARERGPVVVQERVEQRRLSVLLENRQRRHGGRISMTTAAAHGGHLAHAHRPHRRRHRPPLISLATCSRLVLQAPPRATI